SNTTDAAGNQVSPIINYFGTPAGVTPAPVAKDYYYDGSTAVYESATNAQGVPGSVWIYPTMRRGGRMLYGLDVTSASSPAVLWKFGCPYLSSDTGCLGGASATNIGQTWSTPAVAASVNGYNSPVLVVGGGYDGCEDANTPSPSCTSPKGAGVFVLDAHSGAQLAFFPTTRSVAADVALISVAMAGGVDHAYPADPGGHNYRPHLSRAPKPRGDAPHRLHHRMGRQVPVPAGAALGARRTGLRRTRLGRPRASVAGAVPLHERPQPLLRVQGQPRLDERLEPR